MRLLINEDKFESPVKGRISSPYGHRVLNGKKQNHLGIDYSVESNTQIKSPLDGKVIASKDGAGKCGGLIEILHELDDKKITTLYCHLNDRKVKKGDIVQKGDVIGLTGGESNAPFSKKGNSTGPHLHFGVSEVQGNMKVKVDPSKYLEKDLDVLGDLETPELKKKIEKLGDVEIDGESLKDLLKGGKEKISGLTKTIIDKIMNFLKLESEEDKKILERRIIQKLKNKKTL